MQELNGQSRDGRAAFERHFMIAPAILGLCALATAALLGCGTGGQNAAPGGRAGPDATRQGAAALRAARAVQAVLAATRTDAAAALNVAPTGRARDLKTPILQGQEPDGLYYTLTTDWDGSGSQNLFTDSARTIPAGTVTWDPPVWTGGVVGRYPVTITFHVQRVHTETGTATLTLQDASQSIGHIALSLVDSFLVSVPGTPSAPQYNGTENCDANLDFGESGDTGSVDISDSAGDVTEQIDQPVDAPETATFTDSSGDSGQFDMQDDGSAQETIGQGDSAPSEAVDSTGDVTITQDGSSEDGGNLDSEDPTVSVPADRSAAHRVRSAAPQPVRKGSVRLHSWSQRGR